MKSVLIPSASAIRWHCGNWDMGERWREMVTSIDSHCSINLRSHSCEAAVSPRQPAPRRNAHPQQRAATETLPLLHTSSIHTVRLSIPPSAALLPPVLTSTVRVRQHHGCCLRLGSCCWPRPIHHGGPSEPRTLHHQPSSRQAAQEHQRQQSVRTAAHSSRAAVSDLSPPSPPPCSPTASVCVVLTPQSVQWWWPVRTAAARACC